MSNIQVDIDEKWIKLARSPLAFIATSLSGVSVSFAPLFLYQYGAGKEPLGPPEFGVPICWAVILISGFFHIKLSQHVLARIRQSVTSSAR
jgi:hypothetical protein